MQNPEDVDQLVDCVNSEFEDPKFMVSLLAKFSRKMNEISTFSKLKSVLSVHKLIQMCDDQAKSAIMKCISSLKNENDPKCGGKEYFSMDFIEDAGNLVT